MSVSALLSIIIPLYNGKKFIANIVRSVNVVSVPKEIIIVDDGSKDGSEQYCEEICREYADVKVFRKENGGISSARNYGLSVCTGKYAVFVDQDDYIDAGRMSNAIVYAEENRTDAVFWSCDYDADGEKSSCDKVYRKCIAERDAIEKSLLPALLFRDDSEYMSYIGHVWAGVYSTELIRNKDVKFRHFIDYEDDQLFVYDFLLAAKKVGFLPETVYYWVFNPKSYSNTKRKLTNIVARYESYFSYLANRYREHVPGDENTLKELDVFAKQFTFCEAVRNSGLGEKDKGERKAVRRLEKSREYKPQLRCKPNHIREKRFSIYLLLSKLGLTGISLWSTRVYYNRKQKKQRKSGT